MTSRIKKNPVDDKPVKVLVTKLNEAALVDDDDDTTKNSCCIAASSIKVDKSGDSIVKVSKTKGEAIATATSTSTSTSISTSTAAAAAAAATASPAVDESCVDSLNSSIPELPVTVKRQKIPILDPTLSPSITGNLLVPRRRLLSISTELLQFNLRPIVLATHLVPSLPIALFEVLAGIIEKATKTPVVLLHESRPDRPVAQDIVDIAFLPASHEWNTGILLPVGLVFEHRLNKQKTPGVYADIIISGDIVHNVEDVIDLRGHRCALADRRTKIGATGLLFSHLNSKGEGPSFFGDTLDADTQLAALHLVASKQAQVGVLEGPIINSHKHIMPGVKDLFVLDSLGPLPPYQIMVNERMPAKICDDMKNLFLNVNFNKDWLDKLNSYGVIGFAEYSKEFYNTEDMKSIVTSAPYY